MPLLKSEADKLSQNDLVRGIIEEFIDQEELLPFYRSLVHQVSLTTTTVRKLYQLVIG